MVIVICWNLSYRGSIVLPIGNRFVVQSLVINPDFVQFNRV